MRQRRGKLHKKFQPAKDVKSRRGETGRDMKGQHLKPGKEVWEALAKLQSVAELMGTGNEQKELLPSEKYAVKDIYSAKASF